MHNKGRAGGHENVQRHTRFCRDASFPNTRQLQTGRQPTRQLGAPASCLNSVGTSQKLLIDASPCNKKQQQDAISPVTSKRNSWQTKKPRRSLAGNKVVLTIGGPCLMHGQKKIVYLSCEVMPGATASLQTVAFVYNLQNSQFAHCTLNISQHIQSHIILLCWIYSANIRVQV